MILSTKFLATLFVIFTSPFLIDSIDGDSDFDDQDDNLNSSVEETAADSILLPRETASSFNEDDDENHKRSLLASLSKLDNQEVKETKTKSEARRRKAFENYEEACKIKGKYTFRACPKLSDCFARNNISFVTIEPIEPIENNKTTTAVALTTTALALTSTALAIREEIKPKVESEFISQEWADLFLNPLDDDFMENEINESNENESLTHRFFQDAANEIIEETIDRRNRAFRKYEEFCERRVFRSDSERNCPQIDKRLC